MFCCRDVLGQVQSRSQKAFFFFPACGGKRQGHFRPNVSNSSHKRICPSLVEVSSVTSEIRRRKQKNEINIILIDLLWNTQYIILKTIATSGFLAALNCTKFVFRRGSAPDPAVGKLTTLLQAYSDPGSRRPTFKKGKGIGKGGTKGRKGGRKERGGNTSMSRHTFLNVPTPLHKFCRHHRCHNNNNNNIHICIAPYGRNFRGAGPGSVLVGVRRVKRVSLGEEKCL